MAFPGHDPRDGAGADRSVGPGPGHQRALAVLGHGREARAGPRGAGHGPSGRRQAAARR